MITVDTEPKYDSKLEREYAEHLQAMVREGLIKTYYFKPIRLRISDQPKGKNKKTSFYTPDFAVVTNDNSYELHETKGFWREASWVRIRTAAAMHPFDFVAVYKKKKTFVLEHV